MSAAILTLAIALGATTGLWLLSLYIRDSSIIDIFWGPGFALVVWASARSQSHFGAGGVLALALVMVWAIRLSLHILLRHSGEDHRYTAMRKKWGSSWAWWSLVQVFWLQGALIWIISAPLQVAVGFSGSINKAALAGAAIAAIGIFIEGIADFQLSRFRADPESRGKVMDKGIWSWSRHPNYFGDALMWWGYFILALSAGPHFWWTIASPLIMTVLLLRVSGVSLMEDNIRERRPEYADYIRRTSAFVPWPPRKRS
jgi:steroid 5-alpha reductase family enzyme